MRSDANGRVLALLGPTNTGKTFYAIERMLAHGSGIIGFPLRLLARENYERICRIKGAAQVALVTGEEKIVPPNARYFCCTVESMPLDRPVDCLAVDEIQLAADPERGHVFTDRLLWSRGIHETIFMGADTIRPLLRRLVPEAEMIERRRLSQLSHAGYQKLSRLPPRSAVVAFSADQVYDIAEQLRRHRGGTAVVLGALSPRTRNAQVELFESGEVDYLVATDAIGMGLNLQVKHVAFAGLDKFDGRRFRQLSTAEMAQIAGRAGRNMNDGTFGTTNDVGLLDSETAEAIEDHRFPALRRLTWRSRDLDFATPQALLRSLEAPPPEAFFTRVRQPEDQHALASLSHDASVLARARGSSAVKLLWDVCQVPDFHKTLTDQHLRLLTTLFCRLADKGELPSGWVASQLERLNRPQGDIDTLTQRLAQIRTWTYVTHRADWLPDAGEWQSMAREIEDGLSDALHQGLADRFIDHRAAFLSRRRASGEHLMAAVRRNGDVLIEGHEIGRLQGFAFKLHESIKGDDARTARAAARKALQREIPRRVSWLEADDDSAFQLRDETLYWRGAAVGRLKAGQQAVQPRVEAAATDLLSGPERERLRQRLQGWLDRHLEKRLAPLYRLRQDDLPATARGVAYQLVEALGFLPNRLVTGLNSLQKEERRALQNLGVRLGRTCLYLPQLLNRRAQQLTSLLWSIFRGAPPSVPDSELPPAIALHDEDSVEEGYYGALGYRLLRRKGQTWALRADHHERLVALAGQRASGGNPVWLDDSLLALTQGDQALLEAALSVSGYRKLSEEGRIAFRRNGKTRRTQRKAERAKSPQRRHGDSPFAALLDLQPKGRTA